MDYTLKSIRGKNIRTFKALLLSLLLHLLIVFLFVVTFKDVVLPPIKVAEQKISLNLKQFVPPVPKPVVVPLQPVLPPPIVEEALVSEPVLEPIIEPITKPVIQPVIETVPVKKKLLDEKKRLVVEEKSTEENNVTKVPPKVEKKTVQKKVNKKPKKVVKKKTIKKKTKKRVVKRKKQKAKKQKKRRRSKDPLAQMLMNAGTSMAPKRRRSSPSIKMVRQFYGKEFNTFTPTQKKFIKRNLGAIHRITQATLSRNGYPSVALRTRQQGTAIVSFYLHPNGDISGLRLKKRIGYSSLDSNTLKVIRIAYKDYPRPKTKTKITFYVEYSMY